MLCLDSVLALTRGTPLSPVNFLDQLNPMVATYTAAYADNEDKRSSILGQIRYPLGAHSARLTYLTPCDSCNIIAVTGLVDHLAAQAGEWGAYYLVGEVEERTLVFEALRKASFSVYTWQRIWQLDLPKREAPRRAASANQPGWQQLAPTDAIRVRSLYQSVVPALVQPVEPLSDNHLNGLIYKQDGETVAYADIVHGIHGIWVQPFIHPAAEHVPDLLVDLVASLLSPTRRPIYLCVRSYQAWLESALDDLNAQAGPRHAMMVKHMVLSLKVSSPVSANVEDRVRVMPSLRSQNLGLRKEKMAEVRTLRPIARRKTHDSYRLHAVQGLKQKRL